MVCRQRRQLDARVQQVDQAITATLNLLTLQLIAVYLLVLCDLVIICECAGSRKP